jgi:hypothetical protein
MKNPIPKVLGSRGFTLFLIALAACSLWAWFLGVEDSGMAQTGFRFDDPPKEWKTETPMGGMHVEPDGYTHRECEDKSRFMLMSEDGKWHCLKLVR